MSAALRLGYMLREKVVFFLGSILLSAGVIVTSGCAGQTDMIPSDDVVIPGLAVSSQDFRSICYKMAQSMIRLPQIQNAKNAPTIALWEIENTSEELFDPDMFLYKLRTELQKNSLGKITFLDRDMTGHIETEKRDKNRGRVTSSSDKQPRLGADFFLGGRVDGIRGTHGRERTTYLRFSFRLTNASTSAIIWEDDFELKKHHKYGTYDR